MSSNPRSQNEKSRSPWEIVFGFSGLLAVIATVVVALITYNQNLKIQALQTTTARESDKSKSESQIAVQKEASGASLTQAQLKTQLDAQLGKLTDDRERSLNARDLEMRKYINDENVRLGRYSKQSDVDLKLVDIATELLKSESTQTNQQLKQWAVDIVNSHSNVQMSKAAQAEARAAAIIGEPARVFAEVLSQDGRKPISGCSVFYAYPGLSGFFRFPGYTGENGETRIDLTKGAYLFWVKCGSYKSEPEQFYAAKSDPPLYIEFLIPLKPQ